MFRAIAEHRAIGAGTNTGSALLWQRQRAENDQIAESRVHSLLQEMRHTARVDIPNPRGERPRSSDDLAMVPPGALRRVLKDHAANPRNQEAINQIGTLHEARFVAALHPEPSPPAANKCGRTRRLN